MSKTIKEMYSEELTINPQTGLIKRFNSILNKKPSDLTEDDVCLLIRQEFFTEIIIPKAIEMIKNDHSAGDNYEYCMLVNLSEMNTDFNKYKGEIENLISLLEKDYSSIQFDVDDEKDDFLNSIKRLKAKIGDTK